MKLSAAPRHSTLRAGRLTLPSCAVAHRPCAGAYSCAPLSGSQSCALCSKGLHSPVGGAAARMSRPPHAAARSMAVTDVDMGPAAPSSAKPLAQDNNTAADYYTSSYSHCAPPAHALCTLRHRCRCCVLDAITQLSSPSSSRQAHGLSGFQLADAAVVIVTWAGAASVGCSRARGSWIRVLQTPMCSHMGPMSTLSCLEATVKNCFFWPNGS